MLLYRIATQLYFTAIRLAALFGNKKAALWVAGRRNLFEEIESKAPLLQGCYWFHCASLGEFEQGRPLMERIKKEYPQQKIVLTFFSPSGYEVRRNFIGADAVFYLPADTARNAIRFINLLKPKVAIFVKYEFWQYFLYELKKQAIPTFLVSGIFRKEQHFFKWYGTSSRKVFQCFSHLFVQNEQSKNLLQNIGIANAIVAGDTRFDRVAEVKAQAQKLPVIEAFVGDNKVLVVGSSWPEDEKIIAQLIAKKPEGWKFIFAPHEVNEASVSRLQQIFPDNSLYTKPTTHQAQVMIIDCIGILSSAYQYATIAYVGGGFNSGIHNLLEAATYEIPVIFGPNHQRFAEALDLIEHGAGFAIADAAGFEKVFTQLSSDNNLYQPACKNAGDYVAKHTGATQTVLNHFKTNGLL